MAVIRPGQVSIVNRQQIMLAQQQTVAFECVRQIQKNPDSPSHQRTMQIFKLKWLLRMQKRNH